MIPAPFHFTDITREAGLHPAVEAEIEAARQRAGVERPMRRRAMAALLSYMVRPQLREHRRAPAE